ncbi:uncharacterized protein LOC126809732 [Patella vulgata]|uniref:uncharacterized protein LOC126809732 n=1 Tax=Patella vulgata TaxID=6465 RepID=UPI00217F2E76|nr:uncharacterized protein LOC126809732 [Patella vulgata]
MSASLHVQTRKDYLRPSKTLQDLKEKLGAVFVDAKLIECPQNAFELARLQRRIEDLEKQKYRRLADANREQRILYNSLSSKCVSDSSVSTFTDPVVLEIVDNKIPPPGFRFHSNGNPKSQLLTTKTETTGNILKSGANMPNQESTSVMTFKSGTDHVCSTSPTKNLQNVKDSCDACSSNRSSPRPATPHNQDENPPSLSVMKLSYNSLDYESEIKHLEKIIKQLQRDIATKRSSTSNLEIPINVKHNYLRAHSRADDIDDKQKMMMFYTPKVRQRNESAEPHHAHHSKCLACQMKLKHPGSEIQFKRRTGQHDTKTRWKAPPRGTYVSSPRIHTSARTASAPELKRYSANAPSEVILRTYKISEIPPRSHMDSREAHLSPTNKTFQGFHSYHGSSLRRFSSPAQRESQRQAFKSRAECESKDVDLKVGSFLKKLKDENDRQKQAAKQKRYYFLKT